MPIIFLPMKRHNRHENIKHYYPYAGIIGTSLLTINPISYVTSCDNNHQTM